MFSMTVFTHSYLSPQPLAYVVMAVWLIYLIALLATTVRVSHVTHAHTHSYSTAHGHTPPARWTITLCPPSNFLSEKMKLSPSIAGITLLALGNGNHDYHFITVVAHTLTTAYTGAPDIFVVFSGVTQDDAALVLG